jgi:hypothetical protein
MSLRIRDGCVYAYKSVRNGDTVLSVYLGAGRLAVLATEMDRETSAERREAVAGRRRRRAEEREQLRSDHRALREFRERAAAADSAVVRWHRRLRRLADRMLQVLGYHRVHRGRWRRRRAMTTDLSTLPETAELSRLAATGDVRTLERIMYRAEVALYQRSEDGTLNRGGIEEILLQSLGPGFGRVEKEAMLADSRLIARELAPPGSNPAELLMADRAAICWLEVRLLDLDRADLIQQEKADPRRLDLVDRLLSRASARLERSLLALGKLKRLKLPVVMATQINVHQPPRQ